MRSKGSESNLECQLKTFHEQMIKVIDEKCLKITENVKDENIILHNEKLKLTKRFEVIIKNTNDRY